MLSDGRGTEVRLGTDPRRRPAPATAPPPARDAPGPVEVVRIGPFAVSNSTQDDVTRSIVEGALATRGTRPYFAFALHVGGLNSRDDQEYVDAMAQADLTYADGVSVVALARLAGGTRTQRSPTTDIGWVVLQGLAIALGRPARVALVGGSKGLADRAAQVLEQEPLIEVVHTEHGFHEDWTVPLTLLRAATPDVVVVGLGAPWEMKWACRNRALLPNALVLTCGGWFGFIVEDEKRASSSLQRLGLEWAHRLAQDPVRLRKRYLSGARATGRMAVSVAASRLARRGARLRDA